jgi:hypothetical protein
LIHAHFWFFKFPFKFHPLQSILRAIISKFR